MPGEQLFVPIVYASANAIFVIDRSKIEVAFVEGLLRAAGAEGEVERHADLLMSRSSGQLSISRAAKARNLRRSRSGVSWQTLAKLFGYPNYVKEGPDGFRFRWTVDVFNPLNAESRLCDYDATQECLAVLVDNVDFGFYSPAGPAIDMFEELKTKFLVLGDLLKTIYYYSQPHVMFGTMVGHMHNYALAHHYGPRRKLESRENYFWPWAIYPKTLRGHLSYSSDKHKALDDKRNFFHPNLGLFLEELRDGSLFVYTTENCPEPDDRFYAETLGLKSIYDIKLRDYPYADFWEE